MSKHDRHIVRQRLSTTVVQAACPASLFDRVLVHTNPLSKSHRPWSSQRKEQTRSASTGFKATRCLPFAIGAGFVPALLWRHGPVLISPPAAAIVTEVKVKPVPLPVAKAEPVKPKPVAKKKKQEQRWFW